MKLVNFNSSRLKCSIVIFIFNIVAFLFYSTFDPSEIRAAGIFPWDSGVYRDIAEQLNTGSIYTLSGPQPFASRLLFPLIYSKISLFTQLTFSQAAYLLNILSSLYVIIFTFLFLDKNGVAKLYSFTIVFIHTTFYISPLRAANVYPGGGYAFECLLICLLFQIFEKSQTKNLFFFLLSLFIIYFLAIGREFVFYISALALTLNIIFKLLLQGKSERKIDFLHNIPTTRRLSLLTFFSLAGFISSKLFVTDTLQNYSIIDTIFVFGWFHLNIAEFIYPYLYALGPIIILFLVAISISLCRRNLFLLFESFADKKFFILIFIASGIIFAMIGGTDSDRFLLWFFPFFALIGCYSFSSIWMSIQYYKKTFSILFIIVTACWSRFYVPVMPHVFFPGPLYKSYAGVRTNLAPDLFYGPRFLERFRLELQKIPSNDAFLGISMDSPQAISNYQPSIAASISRETDPTSLATPYKGSYLYDLNNIPFPLGFSHNQFDLLVAHPYHGHPKVRAMLLLQWFVIFLVVYTLCIRDLKKMKIQ